MIHTMHPLLADTRLNLARHEAGHFWLAHLLGFEAHDIALGADGGRCSLTYPMVPASFAAEYARSPLQAARWLMGILAVIRVGTYVEVHGGQYGAALRGRDLADTEAWRAAILPLYGADGWTKVYASMYQSMQRWYRYPQVQAVIREMAVPIALQDYISRFQMLSLLEVSGAGLAPDPFFDTTLAPARRSSSPASHQPAAPSGFSQDIIASVHRAIQAGDFFDAQGRLRMPSRAEVAYLQQVNTDVQAGKRVPGLDG